LVDTNCIFLEKVINYESQKFILSHSMQGKLPFLTLDSYCGFHKPKASAATTCYVCKDASERFPRISSFIFLCDVLIGAPAVALALLDFCSVERLNFAV